MNLLMTFVNFSADPSRLILTFGASTSVQDRVKRNTALHWAIQSKNSTVFLLLVKAKANLDIRNDAGETAYSMLKQLKHYDWISNRAVENVLNKVDRSSRKNWFQDYSQDGVRVNTTKTLLHTTLQ
jgi:ankyrin repeat protein